MLWDRDCDKLLLISVPDELNKWPLFSVRVEKFQSPVPSSFKIQIAGVWIRPRGYMARKSESDRLRENQVSYQHCLRWPHGDSSRGGDRSEIEEGGDHLWENLPRSWTMRKLPSAEWTAAGKRHCWLIPSVGNQPVYIRKETDYFAPSGRRSLEVN